MCRNEENLRGDAEARRRRGDGTQMGSDVRVCAERREGIRREHSEGENWNGWHWICKEPGGPDWHGAGGARHERVRRDPTRAQ